MLLRMRLSPCRTISDIVYCNGWVNGKMFCLRVSSDGQMEILDEADTNGVGPTHMAVMRDPSALLIAHVSSRLESAR